MAQVVVLDSLNEDVFVCGQCKLVFNSLQVFLDHNKQCRKGTLEPILNDKSLINAHNSDIVTTKVEDIMSDDKTVNSFSCQLCKKLFKKRGILRRHIKTHNTEKPHQCPICGRCFLRNSHLQRHKMAHKVWPNGLNETTPRSLDVDCSSYACSYCNAVLPNYLQFKNHLKNHLSLKKFKCVQSECAEMFESFEDLIRHDTIAHDSHIYNCHICNKPFTCLNEIAVHQENHMTCEKKTVQTEQYKCSLCDASFTTSVKLSVHMSTENHKKTCIHCCKTFTSNKRLRFHLRIHNDVKPFKCDICDSSFHMRKYLTAHMLTHGDRPFKCIVCNNKFQRRDLLQRHMLLHQKKKIFKCPFEDTLGCKMAFNRNDKLKIHVKCHIKRMTLSNTHKPKHENDSEILEICIIPLDTDIYK